MVLLNSKQLFNNNHSSSIAILNGLVEGHGSRHDASLNFQDTYRE